jgi:excisionase family DNA binding protein
VSGYLTIAEAAGIARVCTRTIRRALGDRVRPLAHIRIGRRVLIAEADLRRWLDAHRVMVALPCSPDPELSAFLADFRNPDATRTKGATRKRSNGVASAVLDPLIETEVPRA